MSRSLSVGVVATVLAVMAGAAAGYWAGKGPQLCQQDVHLWTGAEMLRGQGRGAIRRALSIDDLPQHFKLTASEGHFDVRSRGAKPTNSVRHTMHLQVAPSRDRTHL